VGPGASRAVRLRWSAGLPGGREWVVGMGRNVWFPILPGPPPTLTLAEEDVKTVLWRLDEVQAAVYTEDREVLHRLFELPVFATRSEAACSTYLDSRGRAFAWQTYFAASHWNRVKRQLSERGIPVPDERASGAPGKRSPPPAAAADDGILVRPAGGAGAIAGKNPPTTRPRPAPPRHSSSAGSSAGASSIAGGSRSRR
jgi:hypothetical protein